MSRLRDAWEMVVFSFTAIIFILWVLDVFTSDVATPLMLMLLANLVVLGDDDE